MHQGFDGELYHSLGRDIDGYRVCVGGFGFAVVQIGVCPYKFGRVTTSVFGFIIRNPLPVCHCAFS